MAGSGLPGTPGGGATNAERMLADVYRAVITFMRDRASRGDPSAIHLLTGIESPAALTPLLTLVRGWLADCAAERQFFSRSADPEVASRLLAAMDARERLAPGAAVRVWGSVVGSQRSRP